MAMISGPNEIPFDSFMAKTSRSSIHCLTPQILGTAGTELELQPGNSRMGCGHPKHCLNHWTKHPPLDEILAAQVQAIWPKSKRDYILRIAEASSL